eukprot:341142_1
MGNDLSDKETIRIVVLCLLFVGFLASFGSGIYFVVQQGKFENTTATQCKYDRYEYIDCTDESDTVHTANVDCEYWKVYYYYHTYDDAVATINNTNNDTNDGMCDGEVIIDTNCYCVSTETVSKNGIRTLKELPSKADNKWHDCHINNCDINQFTWLSANEFTTSYTICFIVGSICIVLCIAHCIYLCCFTDCFK